MRGRAADTRVHSLAANMIFSWDLPRLILLVISMKTQNSSYNGTRNGNIAKGSNEN